MIWQPGAVHVFISLRYMSFPVIAGAVDNAGFVQGTVSTPPRLPAVRADTVSLGLLACSLNG